MNNYLCVDNHDCKSALTIGKVYSSTKETIWSSSFFKGDIDLIWVINDLGYEDGYARNIYFRKVEFIDSDNENFQMRDATTGELLAYLTKNKEKRL